ncbi:hypothetical protein cypCar_00033997 [Cyprinus carpio]|nr:hypothetical protein cypCar_00033997 [Cyprinus carpio]
MDLLCVFQLKSFMKLKVFVKLKRLQQQLLQQLESLKRAAITFLGAMGSKYSSLPNFAMKREDTDQNTVTQNTLLLPLQRHCRSKTISMPALALERKDNSDSS